MDRFLVMETMYNVEVSVINYEHGVLIEKIKQFGYMVVMN